MGGGKAPKYPGPTAEELALQSTQNQLLQQQMAMIQSGQQEQNLIAPYLYQQMGLKPTYDPSGKLVGFEELPGFAEQQQQARDLQGLQMDWAKQQLGLQGEQAKSAQEQNRIQQLLNPFTYEAMGITPKYDETGKIIGFEKQADTPEELQAKEIQRLMGERSLAALKGELPIDPTTTRELGQQEQTLRATMEKQLGPGWETSTAGREALERFGQTKAGILASAQRGELTLAEQLGAGRESTRFAEQAWQQGQLRGNPLQNPALFGSGGPAVSDWMAQTRAGMGALAGRNFQSAAQLGSAYGGIAQNLNTLGQWRGQSFQSQVAKSQQQAQEQQTYGAAAGAVAAVAASAALISTRRAKKDISPVTGARSLRLILESAV
jgi:hypothetical protein